MYTENEKEKQRIQLELQGILSSPVIINCNHHGHTESFIKLFFLFEQGYSVKICDCLSSGAKGPSGVPQGLTLGHLFSSMYAIVY